MGLLPVQLLQTTCKVSHLPRALQGSPDAEPSSLHSASFFSARGCGQLQARWHPDKPAAAHPAQASSSLRRSPTLMLSSANRRALRGHLPPALGPKRVLEQGGRTQPLAPRCWQGPPPGHNLGSGDSGRGDISKEAGGADVRTSAVSGSGENEMKRGRERVRDRPQVLGPPGRGSTATLKAPTGPGGPSHAAAGARVESRQGQHAPARPGGGGVTGQLTASGPPGCCPRSNWSEEIPFDPQIPPRCKCRLALGPEERGRWPRVRPLGESRQARSVWLDLLPGGSEQRFTLQSGGDSQFPVGTEGAAE